MYLPPCTFDIEVTLRSQATLPPQPQRQPYVPSPPLSMKTAYYAGDFHIHSRESGDAFVSATVDEIASFAQGVRHHSCGLFCTSVATVRVCAHLWSAPCLFLCAYPVALPLSLPCRFLGRSGSTLFTSVNTTR
jgi:hypothetical protein